MSLHSHLITYPGLPLIIRTNNEFIALNAEAVAKLALSSPFTPYTAVKDQLEFVHGVSISPTGQIEIPFFDTFTITPLP